MTNTVYKILKVMNNNVILALQANEKRELVLIGKGIGFGARVGQSVRLSDEQIEKRYISLEGKIREEYIQLLKQLDLNIMGLCAEFIAYAERSLGKLNPHVYVALTDHIGFAIERIKGGQEIVNPFIFQIKAIYKDEFQVGLKAKEMIALSLGVEINEAEVGFIAFHLHSARKNKSVKETLKHSRVLNACLDIIEDELDCRLDRASLTYTRLMGHLSGILERSTKGTAVENKLLGNIKDEFTGAYTIAKKVGICIREVLQIDVGEHELGYMAIHIDRVKRVLEYPTN